LKIIKDFTVDDDVERNLLTDLMNNNSDAMDNVTEDETNFGPRMML
jgi:hypothetical protein